METAKEVKVGSSLLVPSVQELAKESIVTVPPRYIRLDQDPPPLSDDSSVATEEVPVIDMQSLLLGQSTDSELTRFHLACKEWGFFQLVNHGVSSSLLDKLKVGVQGFFQLPMEEKKKFWQSSTDVEGFGQVFVVSEDQKLEWSDMFLMFTLPKQIRKPHLFPKLPQPLRDVLEEYSQELKKLAMEILAQMAKALKMEEEEMRKMFENGTQSMRMNYYPPCPEPEKVIGLTPHSDASGLTVLLQVNDVEGLQIRKDGKWVPIKPPPNAFVVNLGDISEIISNGTYHSIEHRVVVNTAKERLSIATFYQPNYDGEIGPAHSLISERTPALFRRATVEEYLKGLFAYKHLGRCYLDTMRIKPAESN